MSLAQIEDQCERGQLLLMEMKYLEAENVLAEAESQAWGAGAWDLLSRLYLPLQETRRQRRQRCGEGIVCLDLVAHSASEPIDANRIIDGIPHGQLLVAGWGTIEPALRVRRLAAERQLYLETFLAAVYPIENGQVTVIVPKGGQAEMPAPTARSLDALRGALPADCLLLAPGELPTGKQKGSAQSFALTMCLWERLHAPWLTRAERESDPSTKMRLFRETIDVDYGCEFAHQHLADVARELRRRGGPTT
jgi:hypothetical protein